jgi:hypothetical protein
VLPQLQVLHQRRERHRVLLRQPSQELLQEYLVQQVLLLAHLGLRRPLE